MRSNQEAQLIYHNRSSADFGIYVQHPLTMSSPQLDATMTHINGRNGDLIQSYNSYKNITLTAQVTIFKPPKYDTIYQLQRAIDDWLVGYNYDYLKFSDNPEFLWVAVVTTPPVLTPLIDQEEVELTGTITFNCAPMMYRTDGIHWQNVPSIVYNTTNMTALPDWHLVTDGQAAGNWNIIVNGQIHSINNIESEVYIDGENCQAYNGDINLNSSVEFWNHDAPQLVPGKNVIEIRGNNLGKIQYKPKWRRLA